MRIYRRVPKHSNNRREDVKINPWDVVDMNATIHELKCNPPHFHDIVIGNKTFELRYNDRDYKVGEILFLHEYVVPPEHGGYYGGYTGAKCYVLVKGILHEFEGLKNGWVIMSIKKM